MSGRSSRFLFTLDVLTDGSECTGEGGTIFLSVWRRPRTAPADSDLAWLEENADHAGIAPPAARYAVSGLGDALARLSADQRVKLSPIRAAFLPPAAGEGGDLHQPSSGGLAALLLALNSAGSPSLRVVAASEEDAAEATELAEIASASQRRAVSVATCHVPRPPPAAGGDAAAWWTVYEDEFLLVHGGRLASRTGLGGAEMVFLYSFPIEEERCCIAMVPAGCADVPGLYEELNGGNMPLSDGGERLSIRYFIALDPQTRPSDASALEALGESDGVEFLLTRPSTGGGEDPGILIRSQQVARYFRDGAPDSFPFGGFGDSKSVASSVSPEAECVPSKKEDDAARVRVLESCTSVLLRSSDSGGPSSVLDRRKFFGERPLSDEWSGSLESIRNFLAPSGGNSTAAEENDDENEIDIDIQDDEEEVPEVDPGRVNDGTTRRPHLVVLGTGCASPSAVRGASGYALVFPNEGSEGQRDNSEIVILDAGEGVVTMLERSRVPMWRSRTIGIWISHAHLDHYGGLPNLVRAMHRGTRPEKDGATSKKRKRPADGGDSNRAVPVWVMAPPKVLRFLDLSLKCRHGKHRITGEQFFLPWVHHDPTVPPGPWTHFESVRVDHNCCPSFGLLVAWRSSPNKNATEWFCFSGDTRPCRRLVDAVRRRRRDPSSEPLLLLHEATFADSEREQAVRKKHSTVSEAMRVARDVYAHRVVLTHFSQRYVALKDGKSGGDANGSDTAEWVAPTAFAVDGLWVPLSSRAF